jgi:2-iminobutanoate/2-iminopropanoate deaminase
LPFSKSLPVGDVLYISGQVGINPATNTLVDSSFRDEVGQVMDNIGEILQKYDLSYGALVNVTIFLTDMNHYNETNEVYGQYFTTTYPTRVCIAVKRLPLDANIEITAIARLS